MRVLLEPADDKQKLERVETVTDKNGVARFRGVQPGSYYVEASRLGVEVGPGTVVVAENGNSTRINMEWPLRSRHTAITVAGRLRHRFLRGATLVEAIRHPEVGPLASAKLTLSRIDSEKEIGVIATDSDGNFAFPSVRPGYYLLRVEEKASRDSWYPIDDYLVIAVDPASPRDKLNLELAWTSCGTYATDMQ